MMAVQPGGPVRAEGWTRHSVAIDVPAHAERIEIGLVVTGESRGWFGDLALETQAPEVYG
jgi:hypothetical protein